MKTGIVAFSFGLTKGELNDTWFRDDNQANIFLARQAEKIALSAGDEACPIVAQWEIARAIRRFGFPEVQPLLVHVVEPTKEYLDSDEVMRQAAEVFGEIGVTHVIPVAKPGIHLLGCRGLVKKYGFTLVNRKVAKVPWVPNSTQPWTRGPVRLLFYAVRRVLTGKRG